MPFICFMRLYTYCNDAAVSGNTQKRSERLSKLTQKSGYNGETSTFVESDVDRTHHIFAKY